MRRKSAVVMLYRPTKGSRIVRRPSEARDATVTKWLSRTQAIDGVGRDRRLPGCREEEPLAGLAVGLADHRTSETPSVSAARTRPLTRVPEGRVPASTASESMGGGSSPSSPNRLARAAGPQS